ncbi:hypothetical protein [Caldicellulosiruptor bescii]|nr:hypothetical protein [Caldicellulosiruptor bescii]
MQKKIKAKLPEYFATGVALKNTPEPITIPTTKNSTIQIFRFFS